MRISVIIPAAGASTRYNAESTDPLSTARSKLDEDLGGKTVLQRSVELFNTREEVQQIIVAGPHGDEAFAEFKLRHADRLSLLGAALVRGGESHRYQTVANALAQLDESCTHVAIHDAARPATDPALIDRVFDTAKSHPAVVPGTPVSDTLKRVEAEPIEDDAGADPVASILGVGTTHTLHRVESTIDRSNLMQVQTPQVFERELLVRAYAQDDLSSTDDAGLVERLGEPVVIVEGDPLNLKLTRPGDLPLLRAIMGVKGPSERPTHKRF
ncbi:MAG: 2-C-methyl-D-erythritol 4-phosphate cytidylyltransferase [Phycisphaerales bacterium]|nr:2-C-methyl-D-erythritol 4-phosphate cytidylyltransferase [Phycisphaerales bacterium]